MTGPEELAVRQARDTAALARELVEPVGASRGRWWICTDALSRGGQKILGPFESRGLALEVRAYVERVREPQTYWVDEEA